MKYLTCILLAFSRLQGLHSQSYCPPKPLGVTWISTLPAVANGINPYCLNPGELCYSDEDIDQCYADNCWALPSYMAGASSVGSATGKTCSTGETCFYSSGSNECFTIDCPAMPSYLSDINSIGAATNEWCQDGYACFIGSDSTEQCFLPHCPNKPPQIYWTYSYTSTYLQCGEGTDCYSDGTNDQCYPNSCPALTDTSLVPIFNYYAENMVCPSWTTCYNGPDLGLDQCFSAACTALPSGAPEAIAAQDQTDGSCPAGSSCYFDGTSNGCYQCPSIDTATGSVVYSSDATDLTCPSGSTCYNAGGMDQCFVPSCDPLPESSALFVQWGSAPDEEGSCPPYETCYYNGVDNQCYLEIDECVDLLPTNCSTWSRGRPGWCGQKAHFCPVTCELCTP